MPWGGVFLEEGHARMYSTRHVSSHFAVAPHWICAYFQDKTKYSARRSTPTGRTFRHYARSHMDTRARKQGGGRIARAGAGGGGASGGAGASVEEVGGHPLSNSRVWQILLATPRHPTHLEPPCLELNGIL